MRLSILLILLLHFIGAEARAADDLITTIKKGGEFNLLLKAIQTVGLVQTLDHGGSYTLFAPTDAAFAKMPPGVVDSLFKPENKQKLTTIVEAHLIKSKLSSSDIKTSVVTTFGKSSINVIRDGAEILYGGARIGKRDIVASNGLIHSIDRIVLPDQEGSVPASSTPPSKTSKRIRKS
jgi:uncharacterized surface protein with fasciclin (FAS1) repeats